MSDRWVHLLALGVAAGALVPVGGPWAVAALVVVLALAVRSPVGLCLGAVLLASFLSAGARAAALSIPESRAVSGSARLVTDPSPVGTGLRVDLVVDGIRAEAWAYGSAAARLTDRLAGQIVAVRGDLDPIPSDAPWLAARGVRARLSVTEVGEWSAGAVHHRLANGLRQLLVRGAASLDDDDRALFTGVVFGDDRAQSPVVADDFRAAGLTHLLAVSGQNVAFVLALARPGIARLRVSGRWFAVLGVLGLFATVTRFEASVLRATAMAGIAATADLLGREVSSRRVLSLAVAGLVLVRPLLVSSVAFRLSVAATAGIVWLSPPVVARLRRAGPLALPLAVTIAAQVAVAPILATTFGWVSLVSLPANLLAGPVAGVMMTWGLGAGVVAGAAPGPVAAALHVPTALCAWWLHGVARAAAELPVGVMGPGGVWVLCCGAALWLVVRSGPVRVVGAGCVLCVVLVAAASPASPADGVGPVGRDSSLHAGGEARVLVVGARTDPEDLAAHLRTFRIRSVDLVVVSSGGQVGRDQLTAVAARARIGVVWARDGHRIPGARTPRRSEEVDLGGLVVAVESTGPLRVSVVGPGPAVGAAR